MKKLSILIALVMVFSLLAVPAFAAQSPTMTVSTSADSVHRGDTFTVTVSVSSVENCTTSGFLFDYDENVFDYVSGRGLVNGAGISITNGNHAGHYMNTDKDGLTVQGDLFEITLKVKDNATLGDYTISGDGKVTTTADGMVTCAVNSASVTVACNHNFVDGTCTYCGEADPNIAAPTGSIRLRGATLELKEMIRIIYKASEGVIATDDANVAERGVLLFDSEEKAATRDPAQAFETIILEWDAKESRYIGASEGISARKMGDSQFAVGYLKLKNGDYIFGTNGSGEPQVIEYSPKIYCLNKMNDANPKVANLCRAILHYGAAAQVAQDGATSGLMNEGVAAIPYDAAALGEEVFVANTTVTNGMKLRSATMELKGAISYIVKYTVEDTAISDKQLYAEYELQYESGTVTGSVEAVLGTDGRLWATISGVPAKDMGATLTVRPYYLDDNGEKVYGAELVYSGYEYVRRTVGNSKYSQNDQNLAMALAMYIYYANQYGYDK